MSEMKTITILGAGGWGMALAMLLDENEHRVNLWEPMEDASRRIISERRNEAVLPGVVLPDRVAVHETAESALQDADMVVFALPSHGIRHVSGNIVWDGHGQTLFISAAKGIENKTLLRPSEVLLEMIPDCTAAQIVALSGPSHAEEVARSVPTAVTAASISIEAARSVQECFMNPFFRVYASTDIVGVELGGALKNVIAIAAGIIDGAGFGDNTKAALMIRGIVEITRLGQVFGADPLTFAGLSGMGDLIVTCTSRHSRNRFVGEEVGKGRRLDDVLDSMAMVAEGVRTTASVHDLARKHKVDMPITREVYRVLFEGKAPEEAVHDLMTRDPKAEEWG